jgi:hypothetical protein
MSLTTIVFINIAVLFLMIFSYVIWNLLRKNEKLEDALEQRDNYIQNITTIMSESERKLKEIDSRQIFESDDEIGWFFKGIKEIQELINEYNINR